MARQASEAVPSGPGYGPWRLSDHMIQIKAPASCVERSRTPLGQPTSLTAQEDKQP
jgi:hypothetical protein